jgi:hypothetical protein
MNRRTLFDVLRAQLARTIVIGGALVVAVCCEVVRADDLAQDDMQTKPLLKLDGREQERIRQWLRREVTDGAIVKLKWYQPIRRHYDDARYQRVMAATSEHARRIEKQEQHIGNERKTIEKYRQQLKEFPAEKKVLRRQHARVIEAFEKQLVESLNLLKVMRAIPNSNPKEVRWLNELRQGPQTLYRVDVEVKAEMEVEHRDMVFRMKADEISPLSESRAMIARRLWAIPQSPKSYVRDMRIRILHKDHNVGNDWEMLARLANQDRVVQGLKLDPVTPELARNAISTIGEVRGDTIEEKFSN